ncbi:MAG: hypothetical protein E7121_06315 [Bacteroidales bacterium]|nr:hypothetical protein [Bacteroidales bacterium]
MPSVVSQSGSEKATYGWIADGSKYRVLDESNNGYCYTGSLIYASNNGNLQIESTDFAGGRINLAQTGSAASGTNNTGSTLTQDIHYFHTDHLGSVRAITDNSGSVIEQNAYYPFGSRHTFGNTYAQTTNRFKFNGKKNRLPAIGTTLTTVPECTTSILLDGQLRIRWRRNIIHNHRITTV